MKTTLDLPEDLLIEAKTLAARRKITLKAIVESALRRELRPPPASDNPDPEKFELGPFGILLLKRRAGEKTTLEQIQSIQDVMDESEVSAVSCPRPR
ncbi:MAG: hypothetical protein IT581_06605 [Verrucomicrobiales bacterium]|nr:hypothetical protein [Verrucomicrobiales bacterium]